MKRFATDNTDDTDGLLKAMGSEINEILQYKDLSVPSVLTVAINIRVNSYHSWQNHKGNPQQLPIFVIAMNTAYILIGGNIGNREKHLAQALELLNEYCGTLSAISSTYETAAWGKTDQQDFLNQAVSLETNLSADMLMTSLLKVEEKMGRQRDEKFGPRTIDLDILLFNDEIHDTAHIKIPHPELPNRRFALAPLAEIAGKLVHPTMQKTISELLKECKDKSLVKKWGVSY